LASSNSIKITENRLLNSFLQLAKTQRSDKTTYGRASTRMVKYLILNSFPRSLRKQLDAD